MIFIPGVLVAVLTFPGVIVHEVAHMLFCRLRHVAVLDVCFFRFGNPSGYVVHEETGNFNTTFLISVGPFLVNSALCMFICFPALLPMKFFGVQEPLSFVLLWLGVSIGMHAFPSTQDADVLYRQAKKEIGSLKPLSVLSFPVVVLIYIANILSVFWFDYLYGLAIGLALPALLL